MYVFVFKLLVFAKYVSSETQLSRKDDNRMMRFFQQDSI